MHLPLPTDFSLKAYNRCALSRTATSTWQAESLVLTSGKTGETFSEGKPRDPCKDMKYAPPSTFNNLKQKNRIGVVDN